MRTALIIALLIGASGLLVILYNGLWIVSEMLAPASAQERDRLRELAARNSLASAHLERFDSGWRALYLPRYQYDRALSQILAPRLPRRPDPIQFAESVGRPLGDSGFEKAPPERGKHCRIPQERRLASHRSSFR